MLSAPLREIDPPVWAMITLREIDPVGWAMTMLPAFTDEGRTAAIAELPEAELVRLFDWIERHQAARVREANGYDPVLDYVPAPPRDRRAVVARFPQAADLDAIPAADYVERLVGVEVPRHGTIRCPLHGPERTPSLKVYERDWYCFGCGKGGTIYDLAGLLWGESRPLRGAAFVRVRDRLRDEFGVRRAA